MGTLRSHIDHTGLQVGGIALGSPIECSCEPPYFSWNDGALPDGEIDEAGVIVLDEVSI
jgi:hypothetical protein